MRLTLADALARVDSASESVGIARDRGAKRGGRPDAGALGVSAAAEWQRRLHAHAQDAVLRVDVGEQRLDAGTDQLQDRFRPNPALPLAERLDSLERGLDCTANGNGGIDFSNLPFGRANQWNFGALGDTDDLQPGAGRSAWLRRMPHSIGPRWRSRRERAKAILDAAAGVSRRAAGGAVAGDRRLLAGAGRTHARRDAPCAGSRQRRRVRPAACLGGTRQPAPDRDSASSAARPGVAAAAAAARSAGRDDALAGHAARRHQCGRPADLRGDDRGGRQRWRDGPRTGAPGRGRAARQRGQPFARRAGPGCRRWR